VLVKTVRCLVTCALLLPVVAAPLSLFLIVAAVAEVAKAVIVPEAPVGEAVAVPVAMEWCQ